MWHQEMTEEEIVQFKIEDDIFALVDIDEHTSVEPGIHSEVGAREEKEEVLLLLLKTWQCHTKILNPTILVPNQHR